MKNFVTSALGLSFVLLTLPCFSQPVKNGHDSSRPNLRINDPIKSVGLYSFKAAPLRDYRFWRACGYNTLQFVDGAYPLSAEARVSYYQKLKHDIAGAQKAGFKVGIIILSNMSSHPTPQSAVFDPTNDSLMRRRLEDIKTCIRTLAGADFFTFFGGDPGGSWKPLGARGIRMWMDMARKVHRFVKAYAPKASFNISIWAVTQWDCLGISPFTPQFWDKETTYGKMILDEPDFTGPDCGIEFPLHNYYRSLALKSYADSGKQVKLFPILTDIQRLSSKGVKRIWGWPYFLIDEVDDGYTGYSGKKGHPAQAETRYLYHIVSVARHLRLNGMIGNVAGGPNSETESLNVYAFGRFCRDSTATPAGVIDEFAGYLADGGSQEELSQVLRFIENHSTWEASIPEKYRIRDFDCQYTTAAQAFDALARVRPRANPAFPLAISAKMYISKLKDRLNDIMADEKK